MNRRKGSEWMVVNVEIFMEPWRNIDLLADNWFQERLFLARRYMTSRFALMECFDHYFIDKTSSLQG
jgi:hypothetical protein